MNTNHFNKKFLISLVAKNAPGLLYIFPIVFLLSSCGEVNVEEAPNAKLYCPVTISEGVPTQAYIDENLDLWQFSLNGANKPYGLTKVSLENVHQAGFDFYGEVGYAVLLNGEVWMWSIHDPTNISQIEVSKPVKKAYRAAMYEVYLHIDGTITSNGGIRDIPSKEITQSIDYAAFKDIVDFVYDGRAIFAVDKNGDVWVAGETDRRPNTYGTSETTHLTPIKVPGLKDISRFFIEKRRKFAIDQKGDIFYYFKFANDVGYLRTEGAKANYYNNGGISDTKGNFRALPTASEGALKVVPEKLLPSEGYGSWEAMNYMGVVHLDKEGQLWVYDIAYSRGPSGITSTLKQKTRIGETKVRMDYFKGGI